MRTHPEHSHRNQHPGYAAKEGCREKRLMKSPPLNQSATQDQILGTVKHGTNPEATKGS